MVLEFEKYRKLVILMYFVYENTQSLISKSMAKYVQQIYFLHLEIIILIFQVNEYSTNIHVSESH